MARALLAVVVLLVACRPLNAAVVTFTDRTAWTAAVGSVQIEDLNSFTVDTEFRTAPLALLNMTVSQLGGPPANGTLVNIVDVPPFNGNSIDNTPVMLIDVDDEGSLNGTRVRIDFTTPVNAWGVDSRNLAQGDQPVFDIYDASNMLLDTVSLQTDGFHGFTLTAGETAQYLLFREADFNNAVVWLDNLSFGAAANGASVPEPTSLAALALMGGALVTRRRQRPAAAR